MHASKCLVTGCAGFVGGHLCEKLLAMGHTVAGVDNFFSGHRRNMASFADHPGFRFYETCVTRTDELAKILAGDVPVRVCFHLAAVVSVAWSMDHPDRTMEVNHRASQRLHALCREQNLSTFVFAGSAAEYGETGQAAIKEEAAGPGTVQLSPYGRAKYLTTSLVEQSGYGASLRCFNIYGPRQDPASPYSGVISRFCMQALAGEPVTIFGDGGQTRDFIHVADVVRAYLLAAGLDDSADPPGTPLHGAFNVGRGESTSILELASIIAELAGSRSEPRFFPPRPGDIRHSLADAGKLAAATGFKPVTAMRPGLADTVAWMRVGAAGQS
ncbi:MAG: NAD-dependent epimerase/dehydratase family protein [Desulfovibrionaceae bacterium]|nr:NAD-dependent epimerase/dehydratase family protein [Desulfovibrionaceae bacterium]MBF0515024.1 NAD-dependent epimerase/dehydratase family protein [Desulfovibrionaceae bacterium]